MQYRGGGSRGGGEGAGGELVAGGGGGEVYEDEGEEVRGLLRLMDFGRCVANSKKLKGSSVEHLWTLGMDPWISVEVAYLGSLV